MVMVVMVGDMAWFTTAYLGNLSCVPVYTVHTRWCLHRNTHGICTQVYTGCTQVYTGCTQVYAGYTQVYTGCTQVYAGSTRVYAGCTQVYTGCTQLPHMDGGASPAAQLLLKSHSPSQSRTHPSKSKRLVHLLFQDSWFCKQLILSSPVIIFIGEDNPLRSRFVSQWFGTPRNLVPRGAKSLGIWYPRDS